MITQIINPMDKIQLGHVNSRTENHIKTIEFFHPSHNSLPGNLLKQLSDEILSTSDNDDVFAIVLRSAGDRTFCAGASFDELSSIQDITQGKQFFMGFANVINAVRKVKQPVLCRVQGKAVGGGVGIAAACDYSMATKYGSIRLSELAVGIGPFVIGPAVERKVGLAAFSHLSLSPTEWQTAKWAQSKGMYTDVFESVEQLDAYITHFTEKLVQMNPEAIFKLKKVFWNGTDDWDNLLAERAAMSGKLVLSDFAKKAINGFLQA